MLNLISVEQIAATIIATAVVRVGGGGGSVCSPRYKWTLLSIYHELYVLLQPQTGPFVMNTEADVKQAEQDYVNGKNGFEGAQQWNSFVVTDSNY